MGNRSAGTSVSGPKNAESLAYPTRPLPLGRGDAQARRVALLAALVRSGRYAVPGDSLHGVPLRGYRTGFTGQR